MSEDSPPDKGAPRSCYTGILVRAIVFMCYVTVYRLPIRLPAKSALT